MATSSCDIDKVFCRARDKDSGPAAGHLPPPMPTCLPTLPRHARLPINRCNLPASILGGLTYQRAPTVLSIDGVAALHRPLFDLLDHIAEPEERAARFVGYMKGHFRLAQPDEAGLCSGQRKLCRTGYRKE